MKTTIDLPRDLVQELKMRAVREGRKLKDVAADVLRNGLSSSPRQETLPRPKIVHDKKSGLPVIFCPTSPANPTTADDVAQLLLDEEVKWARGEE